MIMELPVGTTQLLVSEYATDVNMLGRKRLLLPQATRANFRGMSRVNPGGGGVLPSKRLLGMCRWMG